MGSGCLRGDGEEGRVWRGVKERYLIKYFAIRIFGVEIQIFGVGWFGFWMSPVGGWSWSINR